jgi:hypothetical protein
MRNPVAVVGQRVRIGDGGAWRGLRGVVTWAGRFGPWQERRTQVRLDSGPVVMVTARRVVVETAPARLAA